MLEIGIKPAPGRLVLTAKPADLSVSRKLVAKVREKARLLEEVVGMPVEVVVEE